MIRVFNFYKPHNKSVWLSEHIYGQYRIVFVQIYKDLCLYYWYIYDCV